MANKKEFTIKLENSKIFRGIVETLASMIDEVELNITPKGFTISAMDPSRICLLKLELGKGDFDEFESSKDCKIGLNLDDLEKIIKRSSSNDTLVLEYTESEQKLKIKMQREEATRTRTFSLTLLDIECEEVPMDNLLKIDFPSKWTMNLGVLNEAIKDAEIYSESLHCLNK